MQEIVLATGNQGKVKELQAMLAPKSWSVRAQTEWNFAEAEETGLTFIENAIIKARHAATLTGLPALADDSGLAVDALGGEPGIYSARYAGAKASDQENLEKLLKQLVDVPPEQRTAQFHCVLVYLRHAHDPTPVVCHGTWHGSITTQASGSQGFGYDPIFWVDSHQCTAAELEPAVKRQLSHRGKALQQLLLAMDERS
ncbi:RdgB/HAM1 family non-canonical purine NTP pyrophosphatase [Pseudidiomarina aestuarii]|uniref:RdgB/HAM1 family non-canonical purine NTP pyrophosphatase n=1 Tax=Pseudidiomarina aestuarii TaxID=624146 RepID=UPI003A96B206